MKTKARYEPLLAVILLLVLFGQAALSSVRMSLTTDEPMHISMGYTDLALGDYRFLPAHIHPPLVNEWAAWPLLLRPDRPDPRQAPGWTEGNLFQFSAQLLPKLGPIEAVELATRVPIMLLALVLGALVYRWASDLLGAWAGLAALLLYTFDPGIVSSAQFNTTDLGALAFGVLATFAAWRAARHPALRLIVLTGLALGASIASKVSGLFFAPMLVGLVGLTLLRANWGRWSQLGKPVLQWSARFALIYALAFGVVWAVYGFEFKPLPGGSIPIPATSHWLILQAFSEHVAQGHMAFLAGQVSQYGWWWYFTTAFTVKTPLPALILLVTALVRARRSRRRRIAWIENVWLLAIPLAYFINAMLSTIDIGYRHLLPIFPFLFIFIGVQISDFKFQISNFKFPISDFRSRITLGQASLFTFYFLLFAWYIVSTLRIFPDYLTYFNELAGGPDYGYRYLADSNTDWGQALKELAAYQQAEGIGSVKLSMFTFIDPAMYGVHYEPLTPMQGNTPAVFPSRFNPPPGDYVISATTLDGIPLADPEMFDWFRRRQPDAIIGHVMFAYRVKPASPRTWVAQCASPAALLSPEQIVEGFGQETLRLASFDCSQSWVYLNNGSPGWIILPGTGSAWTDQWPVTPPSYEQKRAGFTPPFRIYEQTDITTYNPQGGPVRIAPSGGTLTNTLTHLPVTLYGDSSASRASLTLLDYRLYPPTLKPGETTYLETIWRVERAPERLLSLMAHVLGPDGRAIAVGDGLGVPIESWQLGDVFVQRHTLTVPKDTPPGSYWVQTGVYWLDDGKRWTMQGEHATGDRALLTQLTVK